MKRTQLLVLTALACLCSATVSMAADPAAWKLIPVQSVGTQGSDHLLDGIVEAVRQSTLSTQVAGSIVALHVKAGDRVKAGQELVRVDARSAGHQVESAHAQVLAAQAQLHVVGKELDRQKQLLQKQYISQAAFDRTQAQWDAAQAQLKALQAQAQTAQTQSGFFVVHAPYAGVVSDVAVTLGDMAMPGRPLLTLYDPSALRITAAVPQSLLSGIQAHQKAVRYELPGITGYSTPQASALTQVLPAIDPSTHTGQIRLSLPAGIEGVAPGAYAQIRVPGLPAGKDMAERFTLPSSAVVKRAEMTGVYVLDGQGKPSLRQVRLGRTSGESVEILSGLRKDDRVLADPQLAAASR